jgi:hypothetical protein
LRRAKNILRKYLPSLVKACYSSPPVARRGKKRREEQVQGVVVGMFIWSQGIAALQKKINKVVDDCKKLLHNLVSLLLTNKTICWGDAK